MMKSLFTNWTILFHLILPDGFPDSDTVIKWRHLLSPFWKLYYRYGIQLDKLVNRWKDNQVDEPDNLFLPTTVQK